MLMAKHNFIGQNNLAMMARAIQKRCRPKPQPIPRIGLFPKGTLAAELLRGKRRIEKENLPGNIVRFEFTSPTHTMPMKSFQKV